MHFHGSTWFWSSVSLFDLWFTFRHRAQQHHTPGGNKFDLLKDEKKSGVAKASDGIPWFIWSMLAFFLVLELISLIPSLRCCTFPFDGNSLLTDFIYGWVFFFFSLVTRQLYLSFSRQLLTILSENFLLHQCFPFYPFTFSS